MFSMGMYVLLPWQLSSLTLWFKFRGPAEYETGISLTAGLSAADWILLHTISIGLCRFSILRSAPRSRFAPSRSWASPYADMHIEDDFCASTTPSSMHMSAHCFLLSWTLYHMNLFYVKFLGVFNLTFDLL